VVNVDDRVIGEMRNAGFPGWWSSPVTLPFSSPGKIYARVVANRPGILEAASSGS
jgi:hypothetical protein